MNRRIRGVHSETPSDVLIYAAAADLVLVLGAGELQKLWQVSLCQAANLLIIDDGASSLVARATGVSQLYSIALRDP